MSLVQKIDKELDRLINPSVIERARIVATVAHEGQKRSDGEAYINHPKRVVDNLFSWDIYEWRIICAAWLHDVHEDCNVSLEDIARWFGGDVAGIVGELSLFLPKDCKPFPKHAIKRQMLLGKAATMSEGAVLIKLSDRLDNLLSLERAKWSDDKKEGYAIEGVLLASALSSRYSVVAGKKIGKPYSVVLEAAQPFISRKVADVVTQGS